MSVQITLYICFTLVQTLITLSIMKSLVKTAYSIHSILGRFIESRWIAVITNLFISIGLMAFTGSGGLVGMANLTSSVLVGVIAPFWYTFSPRELARSVMKWL